MSTGGGERTQETALSSRRPAQAPESMALNHEPSLSLHTPYMSEVKVRDGSWEARRRRSSTGPLGHSGSPITEAWWVKGRRSTTSPRSIIRVRDGARLRWRGGNRIVESQTAGVRCHAKYMAGYGWDRDSVPCTSLVCLSCTRPSVCLRQAPRGLARRLRACTVMSVSSALPSSVRRTEHGGAGARRSDFGSSPRALTA